MKAAAYLRVIALVAATLPLPCEGQSTREPAADTASSAGGTSAYLVYRPDVRFGSLATAGPLNVLFNRGLSVMHFTGVERGLFDTDWGQGWHSVRDALTNPVAAIERRGGWGEWLADEWIPTDLHVWSWAWAPNYAGHIVAGGLTYRYLDEWASAHGVPKPGLSAAAFLWGTMLVNEIIENQGSPLGSAGTVGDLLIFDPLGILLFRIDGIARFFSETLRAADWSPMVAITAPNARVQNVSQSLAYKAPQPFFSDRLRILFVVGQGSQTGLTYELDQGLSLGAALGFDGNHRVVDPVTLEEEIDPRVSAGLFLDRDDSLLASLIVSLDAADRIQANVFPGVLPGRLSGLGLWFTLSDHNEVRLGIGTRGMLGLGLGFEANPR